MTLSSILTILGLSFDILGVVLVFNEWRLAVLPEQLKAHLDTIQFFRNLRGRFDDEDRAHHQNIVLTREIAISRIMHDAYETSFRQDNRDELIRKGKFLIVTGFMLQFGGALPWTSISWNDAAQAVNIFLTSPTGETIAAIIVTVSILCLPLISDHLRVARKARVFDGTFTGVWWSSLSSEEELLRINIMCNSGKITGVANARELDGAGLPIIGDVLKYYHVQGVVEEGVARTTIYEYEGTEPYKHAVATLTPQTGNLLWSLSPKYPDYIGWFRKQETLERFNAF